MELTAEELALAADLGLSAEQARKLAADTAVSPPEPEPAVPSIYEDCRHPYLPVGYSERPAETLPVRLDRQKYPTLEEAQARFEELRERNGWRVFGEPFWTARYWCWLTWRPA